MLMPNEELLDNHLGCFEDFEDKESSHLFRNQNLEYEVEKYQNVPSPSSIALKIEVGRSYDKDSCSYMYRDSI